MSRLPTATLALWTASLSVAVQEQEFDLPVFRITARQVVVDFVAIDDEGRFVTDLTRDEIEVIEDGKSQSILTFFSPGRLPGEQLVSPDASAPRGAAGVSGRSVRSGEMPAQTVILIDSRVMDASNFAHTVGAVRRFIEEHLRARHAVMIAEIDRGLKIAAPLTRNRAALLEAVDRLRPRTVYNPLAVGADGADTGRIAMETYLDELQEQVLHVRNSLKSLSFALSGTPGRKHVVYFSEGYSLDPVRDLEMRSRARTVGSDQEARMAAARDVGAQKDPAVMAMVRDVVSMANTFGVSFYTIDARGLAAVPGIGPAGRSGDVSSHANPDQDPLERAARSGTRGEPERGNTELMLATFTRTDVDHLEESRNTLVALAAGTNGAAFFNTNDLATVLRESTLEQENYYLLSYSPSTRRREGRFHNIEVRSSRPGVHIRARRGYLDVPGREFEQARLAAAFENPAIFRQLSPVVQLQPVRGRLQAVLGVAGSQVGFRPREGSYQGEVLFLGRVYDRDGKAVSEKLSISRGFNLNLTPEQFQSLAGQPLLFRSEVELKRGRYRLVLVVEDRLAGTLGAAEHEFEIP